MSSCSSLVKLFLGVGAFLAIADGSAEVAESSYNSTGPMSWLHEMLMDGEDDLDVLEGPIVEEERREITGWVLILLMSFLLLFFCGAGSARHFVRHIADPRRGLHRYVLLALICGFIPGPYFHDSIMGALKGPIQARMHISNEEFASLFAVSSFSGVFMAPAGAVIMYVGKTRFAVLASFLAAVGSIIVTVGFAQSSLSMMLLGRFVFWLALNGLCVVQTIITFKLFKGDELNWAMTVIVCSIRLGGGLSYQVSGPLYHRLHVLDTLWFTVVLVCGAFAATLLFAMLYNGTRVARTIWPMLQTDDEDKRPLSLSLLRQIPANVFPFMAAIGAVWGMVFPFEVIGVDMLHSEFGYSSNAAGMCIAMAPLISLLSPLIAPHLGVTLPDRFRSCFVGLVLLTASFVLMILGLPLFGILVLGFGYAVSVCAFYSTIPVLIAQQVPPELAGSLESLVVGLNCCASGVTMMVSNLLIGVIKDMASYRVACVYLAALGLAGLCCLGLAEAVHRTLDEGREPPSVEPESKNPEAASSNWDFTDAVVRIVNESGYSGGKFLRSDSIDEEYYKLLVDSQESVDKSVQAMHIEEER